MKWLYIALAMITFAAAETKEIVIYNYDYGENEEVENEAEEIYSGKYDITTEDFHKFVVIPEEKGWLTITAHNPMFCNVELFSQNGKLLKRKDYNGKIQFKVKKGRKYYIYVNANSENCKYINVFVPGL